MNLNLKNYIISSPFEPFVPNPIELDLFAKALDQNKGSLLTTLNYINTKEDNNLLSSFVFIDSILYSFVDFIQTNSVKSNLFSYLFSFFDSLDMELHGFLLFFFNCIGNDSDLFIETSYNTSKTEVNDLFHVNFVIGLPISLQSNIIDFLFSNYVNQKGYLDFLENNSSFFRTNDVFLGDLYYNNILNYFNTISTLKTQIEKNQTDLFNVSLLNVNNGNSSNSAISYVSGFFDSTEKNEHFNVFYEQYSNEKIISIFKNYYFSYHLDLFKVSRLDVSCLLHQYFNIDFKYQNTYIISSIVSGLDSFYFFIVPFFKNMVYFTSVDLTIFCFVLYICFAQLFIVSLCSFNLVNVLHYKAFVFCMIWQNLNWRIILMISFVFYFFYLSLYWF